LRSKNVSFGQQLSRSAGIRAEHKALLVRPKVVPRTQLTEQLLFFAKEKGGFK